VRPYLCVIFVGNKICSNYNKQGIDEFISFQAMNIAPISLFFQLCACSHMKFGIIEAVLVGYKFETKNIS